MVGTKVERSGHWDDAIVDEVAAQETLRREGKIVARAEEFEWGNTRMSHNSLAVSPLTGYAIHTLHAHTTLTPPGGTSAKHSHSSEAVMLCLEGAGYSVIDGTRYDWKAGDCFVVPSGSWHQHFNASDTEPLKYFAVSNWPMTVQLGLSNLDYEESSEAGAAEG